MCCYMYKNLMLPLSFAGRSLAFLVSLSVFPVGISAQTSITPVGGEQAIVATLPGDQVWPAVSIGGGGAYVLGQGNANEGIPLPQTSKTKGTTAPCCAVGVPRLERVLNAAT